MASHDANRKELAATLDSRNDPARGLTVGIQPDRVRHKNGEVQSFSDRWIQLAEEGGIVAREVDVFASDIIAQLAGCHGFMWRFGFVGASYYLGKRLLPAIENVLRIPVFPSWSTAWHFEDKVAQSYVLQAARIPTPLTWVLWSREAALKFFDEANYPLVMKLARGYQSQNVRLLLNKKQAASWVGRMFGTGLTRIVESGQVATMFRRPLGAARILAGKIPFTDAGPGPPEHGYFYVQEFLPGNDFDTRVTIIGNRAFVFRRFNRPGDFRASGSGRIDWDPTKVETQFIRLAFLAARRLRAQSIAIDGLFRGDEHVIGEISYTYASWALRECPGHWVLEGNPEDGVLEWVEGSLRAEDAIFADFVELVRRSHVSPGSRHGVV